MSLSPLASVQNPNRFGDSKIQSEFSLSFQEMKMVSFQQEALSVVVLLLTVFNKFSPKTTNYFVSAQVHFNADHYRKIISASIPTDLKTTCSFCILHESPQVDEATEAVIETLAVQDKFLLSFSDQNVSNRLRALMDVHKLRNPCTIAVVQVSSNSNAQNESSIQPPLAAGSDLSLYNLINTLDGVIKKDEDYFIFHSPHGKDIDSLFAQSLVASNVKYKLGIRLDETETTASHKPGATLCTTCFYCANGDSAIHTINIPSHNSKSFHLSSSPSHTLFPDLLKNFHRKEFSVSTPILAKWLIEIQQSSQGYWKIRRGVMNSAFVHIMNKYNFTANFFPSVAGGGTGYRFPNNTWIGTVGDVLSGRAEIGQTTGQIYNRNSVVGFSFPISYEWLTFSTGEPQPTYSWKSVYWPFTPSLWLAVIGSVSVAFLVLTLLLSEKSGFAGKQAGNILIRSFLEQDAKIHETSSTNSTRAFITFWLIFGLLITTSYRSKLVSFLAFPTVELPPDTFEELATSTRFEFALQYLRGAAYSLIKTSSNPTFQTIFRKMDLIENDAECFQKAIGNTHFSCISWDAIASYVYHKNLSDRHGNVPLIKARDTTSFIVVGLTFRKRALFKQKFDSVLIVAHSMGLLVKWTELDYEFVRNERRVWETAENKTAVMYPEISGVQSLKFQNLSGIFIISFIGTMAALLICIVEIVLGKCGLFGCKKRSNFMHL